ncbi:MAG: hypothetical protein RLZZ387_2170 [Chloroflexota bacterium]|jgi:hypothetical protein
MFRLRRALAGLLLAGLVSVMLGLAGLGIAVQQGLLPPFAVNLRVQGHAELLIRNKNLCPRNESYQACHYRMVGPPAFSVVYQDQGLPTTLVRMLLPQPGRPTR